MLSLEVTGIDGVTSGTAAVSALRAGFAHLLDTLDERFTFYLHRMMRPAETGIAPIHGLSFAADIDRAWGRELNRRNLQDSVLILTVVRRQVAPLAVPLFGKAAARVWGEDTARRLEELREVVSILETGLGIKTRRVKISDGSLVGFLRVASDRRVAGSSAQPLLPPRGRCRRCLRAVWQRRDRD
jgi:type IV secretion system protein VirB4